MDYKVNPSNRSKLREVLVKECHPVKLKENILKESVEQILIWYEQDRAASTADYFSLELSFTSGNRLIVAHEPSLTYYDEVKYGDGWGGVCKKTIAEKRHDNFGRLFA